MNKFYLFLLLVTFYSNSFSQDGNCELPSHCDRTCWDPSGNHPADNSPSYTTPTHIIVHHSGNNYSSGTNYSNIIRSIWNYHVNTNGWDDIGYNWLIDPNGILYEGRGDGVRGAHFSGMNSYTMGVCLIGNFQTANPSTNAINKLQDLTAWEATDKNIDVLTSSYLGSTGLYLHHISGHRDGGATDCPGNNLYSTLNSIRTNVANYPCYSGVSSPANDECNNAIFLNSNQNCNYTNGTVDVATSDNSWNDATCDNYANPLAADVFYKFTATSNSHTITVNPTGNLDPVLSLYQGSNCYNLNEIDCADSGGGDGENEILNPTSLNIGEIYWIRIYDFGSVMPTNGDFEICITHEVSSGYPDIIVQNENVSPSTIQAGNTLSVSCRIRNNSSYDATTSGRVGFYLSTNTTYDGSDERLDRESFGVLEANEYSDEDDTFTIPSDTPSGIYYILFFADYLENIDESNENNNIEYQQIIVNNTLSIENYNLQKEVVLYPNPTKGIINIKNKKSNIKSLKIYDINGRLMFSKDNVNNYIDISNITPGVYIIRLLDDKNNKIVYRVIKE